MFSHPLSQPPCTPPAPPDQQCRRCSREAPCPASVSRSASPSRNWTGWGCPSLIAMLDAYRYVRSSVSRIGFSVPSIPGSSPTASEKMAKPPPGRAGRSRARACSAGLQFSRTVASSPSRAANTVIGRCVAYNCTRASPPSSVLALTQVLLGNSTRSSTPDAGLPALRVMITVSAGVTSVAAAGIVRSQLCFVDQFSLG